MIIPHSPRRGRASNDTPPLFTPKLIYSNRLGVSYHKTFKSPVRSWNSFYISYLHHRKFQSQSSAQLKRWNKFLFRHPGRNFKAPHSPYGVNGIAQLTDTIRNHKEQFGYTLRISDYRAEYKHSLTIRSKSVDPHSLSLQDCLEYELERAMEPSSFIPHSRGLVKQPLKNRRFIPGLPDPGSPVLHPILDAEIDYRVSLLRFYNIPVPKLLKWADIVTHYRVSPLDVFQNYLASSSSGVVYWAALVLLKFEVVPSKSHWLLFDREEIYRRIKVLSEKRLYSPKVSPGEWIPVHVKFVLSTSEQFEAFLASSRPRIVKWANLVLFSFSES